MNRRNRYRRTFIAEDASRSQILHFILGLASVAVMLASASLIAVMSWSM